MSWVYNEDGSADWVDDSGGPVQTYGAPQGKPIDPNIIPAANATQGGQQGTPSPTLPDGSPVPAGGNVNTSADPLAGVPWTGDPQSYVQAVIAKLGLHASQTDPTIFQKIADALKAHGVNASPSAAGSGGYYKGINIDGNFIKLVDGNNNWIWMPGGNAGGESGNGLGGIDPSYLAPFTKPFTLPSDATLPQVPNAPAFSYPDFKAPSIQDILNGDPGYQFRLDQGRKSIEASASSKGLLNSGGTLADILGFGQEMASQEADNAFNRAFNVWGANRSNAADIYAKNYNTQYVDPFQLGSQRANDIYGRAQQEFGNERDLFFQNQTNPFNKLYSLSNLGLSAASA